MAVPFSSFRVLFFISLLITLRITPVLSRVPRGVAVENTNGNASFFASFDAGLAPRWFMEGTPAIPAQPVSPNRRHLLRGNGLAARQGTEDDRPCPAGEHSCAEANSPGFCCPNDRYCYLDAAWAPKCCSLGVKCPGSLCGADELFCNQTSTLTVTPTTTAGRGSSSAVDVTVFETHTSFSACCNRQCSATSFACAAAFGGQCCRYGFKCASGGLCIADPVPSTSSSSISTIVSEIPPNCTTSQIACAETDGGGCCGVGSICTTQDMPSATSSLVCAPNLTLVDHGSGGLTTGARAGIGIGVAVGAALVIGAVTWLCLRRRRSRSRSATPGASASAHEMRSNGRSEKVAGWTAGRDAGQDALLLSRGPLTPRTDESGPTSAGVGQLYFGPDAIPGPFTDRDGDGQVAYDTRFATTPPTASGDPSGYFGPENILRPVEIGGAEAPRMNREVEETGQRVAWDQDATEGPFELVGSPGSPSPLGSDGVSPPTDAAQKR
ncbi:hypothetical protein F5Y14DRAFT_235670 [Nemania sp. NC0429]|nr:hypothetical protein F5Y14DRAFT_235670 [Nemania sp. NC0429]